MTRLILASCLLLLSCRSAGEPAAPPAPRPSRTVTIRRDLPEAARVLLTDRMQGHADQMAMLFWSALFLDDTGVAQIADELAAEPKLARPTSAVDDTVNAQIPADFFELQDALEKNAQILMRVVSTRDHDATQVAEAYGTLAGTCIRCHERYLYRAE